VGRNAARAVLAFVCFRGSCGGVGAGRRQVAADYLVDALGYEVHDQVDEPTLIEGAIARIVATAVMVATPLLVAAAVPVVVPLFMATATMVAVPLCMAAVVVLPAVRGLGRL
jgi:hypothetical protein